MCFTVTLFTSQGPQGPQGRNGEGGPKGPNVSVTLHDIVPVLSKVTSCVRAGGNAMCVMFMFCMCNGSNAVHEVMSSYMCNGRYDLSSCLCCRAQEGKMGCRVIQASGGSR